MTVRKNINQKLIQLKPLWIVLLVLLTIALLCTPSFAAVYTALQNWIEYALDEILTGTLDNPVLEFFETPIYNNSTFINAWLLVTKVYKNIVKPIAIAIVGITFVVKIVQMTMDIHMVTFERLFTPFVYLVGSTFLIANTWTILKYIIRFGAAFASGVAEYVEATLGDSPDELISSLMPNWEENPLGGFAAALLLCLELLLPFLIWWLGNMLLKVIAWGVLLELVLRSLLFPLFVCDFQMHGFEGQGMRQLKGLLACSCTGAVLIAISGIQSALVLGVLQEGFTTAAEGTTTFAIVGVGQIIIIMFACITIMGKATSLVREAFGA